MSCFVFMKSSQLCQILLPTLKCPTTATPEYYHIHTMLRMCTLQCLSRILDSSYHYDIPHANILHIVTPHNVHFHMRCAECTTSVSPYYRMCAHTVFPPGREIGETSKNHKHTYSMSKYWSCGKKELAPSLPFGRNTHCMYIILYVHRT